LCIFNRHVKNVGYTLAFEPNFQSLAIIPRALAGFALHIDIGQKVHLDLDHAVALTGLAAPALDVETEPARFIAPRFGLGQTGEPVADRGEGSGVSGWIRT